MGKLYQGGIPLAKPENQKLIITLLRFLSSEEAEASIEVRRETDSMPSFSLGDVSDKMNFYMEVISYEN